MISGDFLKRLSAAGLRYGGEANEGRIDRIDVFLLIGPNYKPSDAQIAKKYGLVVESAWIGKGEGRSFSAVTDGQYEWVLKTSCENNEEGLIGRFRNAAAEMGIEIK